MWVPVIVKCSDEMCTLNSLCLARYRHPYRFDNTYVTQLLLGNNKMSGLYYILIFTNNYASYSYIQLNTHLVCGNTLKQYTPIVQLANSLAGLQ